MRRAVPTGRQAWAGVIEEFRRFLPVGRKTPVVTLLEGNTPLIRAERLEQLIGKNIELYLKYEGLNPTGSFKDRGMTVAVSKALEEGSRAVICASTGNTSASASAYAARCALPCFVVVPEGNIALGKLAQALIHGAMVIQIKGNFDEALSIVREITTELPITLVNSVNPYRIEGQKTGAFEICSALGRQPDFHAIPVGNAGNITAYWKGYMEYKAAGKIDNLPRMLGFQAKGSAPIVRGKPVKNPRTIATAIKIGNPASWKFAEEAARNSRGLIDIVSDKEILEAYRYLAGLEGIFVEPASAASVAGIIKLASRNFFRKPATVVCILTGHGLKDPERAIKSIKKLPQALPAKKKAVAEKIRRSLG